jgi:phosphatidylglycerol---prolipoprotein diacylglyceryl transferase
MTVHLLMWAIGVLCGLVAALLVLRARGALSRATVTAIVLSGVGLLVGAKLHHRIEIMPLADALAMHPADLLSPGLRMPLGLFFAGTIAVLVSFLLRAPWRETGDAWAVAASVVIPVGRLGCIASGCCMGSVCDHWPSALCMRFGPGSEAYHQQLGLGLISPYETLSLPVHPLAAYFGIASLLTLAVLVVLLRRGAAPGTCLAVFCVLRPAAKLALESLRAMPRPAPLMVGIPTVVLLTTCLVLVSAWWRHRERTRTMRAQMATPAPAWTAEQQSQQTMR